MIRAGFLSSSERRELAIWAQHHQQTAPLAKNWIMPVINRTGVVQYVIREYWRMGSETLLDEISWSRSSGTEMVQYEHDAQRHRVLRAASPIWLRQAQQALTAQLEAYAADDGNLVARRG